MKSFLNKLLNWDALFSLIGICAFVLGVYSFLIEAPISVESIARAIISSLQLFLLNVSADSISSTSGLVAAFLAPISTIGAVILIFGEKISNWITKSLILQFKPADCIFIGTGESAAEIGSRLYLYNNFKMIGIDLVKDTPFAIAMRSQKIPGFIHLGDGLDIENLSSLKPNQAKSIFISTGNDLRNIEIGRRVISLVKKTNKEKIKLYIQINDYHLIRIREFIFRGLNTEAFIVDLISSNRLAARAVINQHPPQLSLDQNVPHILIVGCSELSSSLLIHSVQHCVYHESEVVRITWVGQNVSQQFKQLQKKFVALNSVSENPYLSSLLPLANIHTIDCDEDEVSPDIWIDINKKSAVGVVYISTQNDELSYCASLRLTALREITADQWFMPIVVCTNEYQSSLSTQAKEQSLHLLQNKHLYVKQLVVMNPYDQIVSHNDTYIGESKDFRAMLVNGIYCGSNNGNTSNLVEQKKFIEAARKTWMNDIENGTYRWSSQLSADHVDIKIQLLKKYISDEATLDQLPDQVESILNNHSIVEDLSKLEHRRFFTERLIEGWLPIDINKTQESIISFNPPSGLTYKQQKNRLSLNYTLTSYSELPNIDKMKKVLTKPEIEKDYDIVRSIPMFIRCAQLQSGDNTNE